MILSQVSSAGLPIAINVEILYNETCEAEKLTLLRRDFLELSLSVGDDITDEDEEKLRRAAEVFSAVLVGLRLLGYSDASVRKLSEKLRQRGFDRETAKDAALAIRDLGYINEAESVRRLGERIAETKLRGRRRVAEDLSARGYDRELIREIIEDLSVDFGEICARAIKKRGGIPDGGDEKRKLLSYLYRQGFSADDIRRGTRILSEEEFS